MTTLDKIAGAILIVAMLGCSIASMVWASHSDNARLQRGNHHG